MSSSRSVRPPALMTSTPVPSSASRSRQRRTWSTSVRPDWKSTSRSTSLVGVAVPLATEPNTRTFDAPWAFATRRMSDLCERSMAKLGTLGSFAAARCMPTLTILGASWDGLAESRATDPPVLRRPGVGGSGRTASSCPSRQHFANRLSAAGVRRRCNGSSRSTERPARPLAVIQSLSQGGDTGSNPVGAASHPESGLCQEFARESYTVTTSTSFSSPRKSSGFRVYRGNSAAHAVAAIRRSTARAPRALRPLATTAA